MESSYSTGENFEELKTFTKEIIKTLDVGPQKSQVSLVTYGDFARHEIKLTNNLKKDALLREIDTLMHHHSGSAIDDAIRVVRDDIFSLQGTSRQGAGKVVVFLANSNCSTFCKGDLEKAVEPLKHDGVSIFTIAVTENIDPNELILVASKPSEFHAYEVFSFSGLRRLISSIVIKACSGESSNYLSQILRLFFHIQFFCIRTDLKNEFWTIITHLNSVYFLYRACHPTFLIFDQYFASITSIKN